MAAAAVAAAAAAAFTRSWLSPHVVSPLLTTVSDERMSTLLTRTTTFVSGARAANDQRPGMVDNIGMAPSLGYAT